MRQFEMDLGRSRGFDVGADTEVYFRGLLLLERDDACGGRGGYRDGRGNDQRLVDSTAADYMLDGLHRLAGTDGDSVHSEFGPGFQRIRRERVVQTGDTVEIVVRLLYILAMKTGLGKARVFRDGEAEVGGLTLVSLQRTVHRVGGGDVPFAFAGGPQGYTLDLYGEGAGVGEVGGDCEGLAGYGGGEGVLRLGGEAGAAAVRIGWGDHRGEGDSQGLDNGAVELRFLYG